MRILILIALCLAVASAQYANRNRFNRMLRNLQQRQQRQGQQGQQQGYYGNTQGLYNEDQNDECGNEEDEEGDYNQQNQQCQRNQLGGGNWNMDNDEDSENDNMNEDDEDQWQQQQQQQQGDLDEDDLYQGQQQGRQGGQQQLQQKKRQQQKHQCTPKYHLLQQLEQPNSHLAAKLYKQAKQENDDKNTVVSPAGLQLALAALKRGARGNTKRQLQRITGAGLSQQQNRQAHAALQNSLQGQDPMQQQQQQQQGGQNQRNKAKITTTIIINQRNRAQQNFIQNVKACTNTQVKKCNFQQHPQQCRQQINRYIAQKTNQKLKHTVPQDAITENTKMIVINTAQVKAKWGRQFRNRQQTTQGKFYPLGGQQPKRVQMLQSKGQFNYYEDGQMKVVGIPTQQQQMTLYVIVPKDKQGLNQLEKAEIEVPQQLKQLLDNADQQQRQVQVELPKIQIKHKIDAKQTLRKEGVQDAFDNDEADFSGITGQQQQGGPRSWQQQNQDQEDEDQYGQQGQYGQQLQQQNRRNRRWQQQGQDDEDQDQDQNQQYGGGEQQQQAQKQLHVNKLIQQATIKIDEQGIHAAKSRNQNQNQGQGQGQQDWNEEGEDEDEDEYGQQQQQYWNRQNTLEDIFGGNRRQRQGQWGQRRNRRQQQQQQQQQQQYGDEDEDEDEDENQNQGQYQNQNQRQGQYQQGQRQGQRKVKANRAFAFALKHNPSNQIVLVGRVVDAAQKPKNQQGGQRQQGQSLNGVDQQ